MVGFINTVKNLVIIFWLGKYPGPGAYRVPSDFGFYESKDSQKKLWLWTK